MKIFTNVSFSKIVALGSAALGFGVAAYTGASPLETLLATLAVPGTLLVAATGGKLFAKFTGNDQNVEIDASAIGDVETLGALLAGGVYAYNFAESPAQAVAELTAVPWIVMLAKTLANRGQTAANDVAPARSRKQLR
ncbi:MAG: hypothetical protein AB7V32_05630 [Candidatus Berkiella sp.]